MELNADRLRQLIRGFDIRRVFLEELGWDSHHAALEIRIDGRALSLTAVAQKRGMVVYRFSTPAGECIPEYPLRRKIEKQAARHAHEHIIIFTDPENSTQIWQWVKREPEKPAACREHTYHKSQPGDALIQKLSAIAFSLDEEETLTLTDVTRRVRSGLDVERVTKRFYDRFKKEHAAFLKFITGHHRERRPGLVCVSHAEPPDVRLFHPAQGLPRRRYATTCATDLHSMRRGARQGQVLFLLPLLPAASVP